MTTTLTGNTYYQRFALKNMGFKWNADNKAWVSDVLISEENMAFLKGLRGVQINGVENAIVAKPKVSKADIQAQLAKAEKRIESLEKQLALLQPKLLAV
jgi:hypothetical protein